MAIIKAVSSRAPIGYAIDYISHKEKTEINLITGIGVAPETAKEEMQVTKELYGKTGGRTYKHFVQSFAPGEKVTPQEAHVIANQFVKECPLFSDFEVLIATHNDRNHVHSHLIVNSVSYKDGHKYQMSANDLQSMKDLSDDICKEHNLSITKKGKTFEGEDRKSIVDWVKEKYQFLRRDFDENNSKSYINKVAAAVKDSMNISTSREDFINMMEERGCIVDWRDNRKHITFSTTINNKEGKEVIKKVRDSNLNKTFNIEIGKKELEELFEKNKQLSLEEEISINLKEAIKAYYIMSEYEDAKRNVEKELYSNKTIIEVCKGKYLKASETIENIKLEQEQLHKEIETCTCLNINKKRELTQRLEHSKILTTSIEVDRDEFLKKYGFEKIEEIESLEKEVENGQKIYEKVYKVVKENKEKLESSISKINEKDVLKRNVKLSVDDRQRVIKDLEELFGEKYSDKKFNSVEMSVCRLVDNHNLYNNQLIQNYEGICVD